MFAVHNTVRAFLVAIHLVIRKLVGFFTSLTSLIIHALSTPFNSTKRIVEFFFFIALRADISNISAIQFKCIPAVRVSFIEGLI